MVKCVSPVRESCRSEPRGERPPAGSLSPLHRHGKLTRFSPALSHQHPSHSPKLTAGEDQHFLWGVATSGYQAEGGYNQHGQPQNNWATAEQAGEVEVTGEASGFRHRYEEDFELCRQMGLTAFRLGLEWSRIQPVFRNIVGEPPPLDPSALQFYVDVLAACRRAGLEPVVTLHHFTHPAWLGPDAWLEPRTVELFQVYVEETVQIINAHLADDHGLSPIKYYVTINEPNMLVINSYLGQQFPASAEPGFKNFLRAYNHLLSAHVRAHQKIHDIYEKNGWPRPLVTTNNYCSDLYWNDHAYLDLLCTREFGIGRNDLPGWIHERARSFHTALWDADLLQQHDFARAGGEVVRWIADKLGARHVRAERFTYLLDTLERHPTGKVLDYLGLDYYDPFTAHIVRMPTFADLTPKTHSLREWLLSSVLSRWWDWRSLPRGLHFFVEQATRDWPGRPVLIAENGMAQRRDFQGISAFRRDSLKRSDFLAAHLAQVQILRMEGVPLIGYLHWSLFDNYEWGTYTPRFGLYSIDYKKGTDRIPTDHLDDHPAETYAALIKRYGKQRHLHPGAELLR